MKLIETIDISTLGGGIFQEIRSQDSGDTPLLPWLDDTNCVILDEMLYLQHSADKEISAYFKRLLKLEDDGIIGSAVGVLATHIIQKFTDKWNRIYNAFVTENYKPLENYNMKQKETPNVTRTKNVKSNLVTDNDVYGFNSSTPVPSSKTTNSGAKLDNEETESETGTRDLERSGNIGVTTSQQMLTAEIDLRNGYNFYDGIMSDVDSILCLWVY